MLFAGLDYHTKSSYVSILDEENREISNSELDSQCELAGFLESLQEETTVLFEAGYGWPRLEKLLEDVDVKLVMCHPGDNRRIANDRRKSDSRDARNLAVYLKTEGYKPAYMPDAKTRDERQLVRGRSCLRSNSTSIRNQIHGLLAYAGVPKAGFNIFAKKHRGYLESVQLPELAREILNAKLAALDQIEDLIALLDTRIVELNKHDPLARLLKTIPGVGDFTARVLLAEVGDISRFPTDKALSCYTGLTPGQRQSGETLITTGLTKEGSPLMRWVLVQAAWVATRVDKSIRARFDELEKEKGAKIAICAIARRLAVAAWHILTKEVPYKAQKPKEQGQLVVARGKPKPKAYGKPVDMI